RLPREASARAGATARRSAPRAVGELARRGWSSPRRGARLRACAGAGRSVRGAVVVVNWNGTELLPGCLDSLRPADPPLHVVVVDNASTDGSADAAARAHPEIELVRNPHNDGWARGNNVGIRKAMARDAEWIALFNTDARPRPGWTRAVEAALA